MFTDDFRRRMNTFDALVGSVLLYGAKIWEWKNEARIDRIKRKYIKWILGLDRTTPNYILVKEIKMIELRLEAVRRAIKYKEKARKSKKKLVVECIKNLETERMEQEDNKLKRIGIKKEVKKRREDGDLEIVETILEKIWTNEKEERRRRKLMIHNTIIPRR